MQDTKRNDLSQAWRHVILVILILVIAYTAVIAIAYFGFDGRIQAAHDALARQIASESGGKITLADFQKTDGQASQFGGVEGYSLTFTGVLTFGANGFWEAHYMGSPFSFSFSATGTAFGGLNGETRVQAGSQVRIAGRMDGQKSEQGWHFGLTSCQVAQ